MHLTSWEETVSATALPAYDPAALAAALREREDGQTLATRISGTIETVHGALAWLTPAAVTAALASGRRVERQGDVYAIETTRPCDGKGELPGNHAWDAGRRVLAHPEH